MQILFLEDDADTREMVTVLLRQSDIQVSGAETSGDALRQAETKPFDAFLLDGMASDGDSLELCRILRSRFPERPIIVYSGKGNIAAIKGAMAAGATAYLVKPYYGDLARVVTDWIRDATIE